MPASHNHRMVLADENDETSLDVVCSRCGMTGQEVQAERAAQAAAEPQTQQDRLAAEQLRYAMERKHQDDLSFRRDDYARTGRR